MLKTECKKKIKNWVIFLVPMFPLLVMVLKLSKRILFLQFCADHSKKFKSVKAINIYSFERSHFLKECKENFQMQYVNCFDLGFLLKLVQNCKKFTFSDNLRTIT